MRTVSTRHSVAGACRHTDTAHSRPRRSVCTRRGCRWTWSCRGGSYKGAALCCCGKAPAQEEEKEEREEEAKEEEDGEEAEERERRRGWRS